jgi:ribosomal protein S18 acetylase RimI-like enzyme
VIVYSDDVGGIVPEQLAGGFFEGWPAPPSPELHLAHLKGAEIAMLAIDDETGRAVGFATAVGDGVLVAFIPLLEVLPAYRHRGIGTELIRRLLDRLEGRYSIDLLCDPEMIGFYERLGATAGNAMLWRDPDALKDR